MSFLNNKRINPNEGEDLKHALDYCMNLLNNSICSICSKIEYNGSLIKCKNNDCNIRFHLNCFVSYINKNLNTLSFCQSCFKTANLHIKHKIQLNEGIKTNNITSNYEEPNVYLNKNIEGGITNLNLQLNNIYFTVPQHNNLTTPNNTLSIPSSLVTSSQTPAFKIKQKVDKIDKNVSYKY